MARAIFDVRESPLFSAVQSKDARSTSWFVAIYAHRQDLLSAHYPCRSPYAGDYAVLPHRRRRTEGEEPGVQAVRPDLLRVRRSDPGNIMARTRCA